MRDEKLMDKILREAQNSPDGTFMKLVDSMMIDDASAVNHQIDLLCDDGLMVKVSKHVVRITDAGYDFLEGRPPKGS